MQFNLYTDGACQPNPGKGGWAFICIVTYPEKHPNERVTRSGYEETSTNNRMEITAVLEGLKHAVHSSNNTGVCPEVTLYADSIYILRAIDSWLRNWSENGWKRKDKKSILNADLWKQIHKLLHEEKRISITSCVHIKGHSGHPENEECDQLAVAEIQINK